MIQNRYQKIERIVATTPNMIPPRKVVVVHVVVAIESRCERKLKFAHRPANPASGGTRKSRPFVYARDIPAYQTCIITQHDTMDIFEKLFTHRREYRVIVCKRCQFAVNPASVKGHIQRKHKTVTKEQCARAVAFINGLSQVAQTPGEVKYPDAQSPAIPGIPVYANGLRCVFEVTAGQECNYTCRERSGMQKHCKEHNYENPRGRGRPTEDTDRSQLWVENQTCQELFKTGTWRKIFPVQVVPSSGQAPTVDIVNKANKWMDKVFADMDQEQERIRTERNRYEPNPWLEHTGWERHLPSDCRQWITEFVKAKPNTRKLQERLGEDDERFDTDREKALSRACEGTVLLIRRSFQISRVEIVGRHALHCVNRRENGAPNNDKPFYGKQKTKTIRKYANVFTQILRYIWRTAEMSGRPKYRLTDAQQQALAPGSYTHL